MLTIGKRLILWEQRFKGFSEDARVWIAEFCGEIAGFCTTGLRSDIQMSQCRSEAEVYTLFVLPKNWRMGIGRMLLDWSVSDIQARGFKSVVL
jgi:ribosomal protein S18 acetylase RimI-like enzyme